MIGADLAYALDPVLFARSVGFDPDNWQSSVLRSHHRQVILNVHRQGGKSTVTSLVALHRALYQPGATILLVSPSLRQSSELFRKVRGWIDKIPRKVNLPEDNKLSCTLENGSRIISLPSSEETVRGFTADLIIFDEASRVDDALYFSCRPMLATTGGSLLLMSTPFGKRGFFWNVWSTGEGWERFSFQANQNARISQSFLDDEYQALGQFWYSQEYECQFLDPVDSIFGYDLVVGAFSSGVKPLFSNPLLVESKPGNNCNKNSGVELLWPSS